MVGHAGDNASVEFRFGESLPSIVCAILQVTDIELEKGETITHINLGDSTRWTVESAVSGSRAEQVSSSDRETPRYRAINLTDRHDGSSDLSLAARERRERVYARCDLCLFDVLLQSWPRQRQCRPPRPLLKIHRRLNAKRSRQGKRLSFPIRPMTPMTITSSGVKLSGRP